MMFIRNLISIMNLYLIIVFNNISTYITCSNFDLPLILQNIVEACLIHSEFRNKELQHFPINQSRKTNADYSGGIAVSSSLPSNNRKPPFSAPCKSKQPVASSMPRSIHFRKFFRVDPPFIARALAPLSLAFIYTPVRAPIA